MTTMVERVARAILRRRLGHFLVGAELDRCVDQTWHYWVDDAGAALAAARVPTEGMQMAMVTAYAASLTGVTKNPADRLVNSRDTDAAWKAGVDSALAESAPKEGPK